MGISRTRKEKPITMLHWEGQQGESLEKDYILNRPKNTMYTQNKVQGFWKTGHLQTLRPISWRRKLKVELWSNSNQWLISQEETVPVTVEKRTTSKRMSSSGRIPVNTLNEAKMRKHIASISNKRPLLLSDEIKSQNLVRFSLILSFPGYSRCTSSLWIYAQICICSSKVVLSDRKEQGILHRTQGKAPYRCKRSKRIISKDMFLVAAARPRYHKNRKDQFVGKHGT